MDRNIYVLTYSRTPELASVITWMPHGRSWKILDRELFASLALPRYFGHSNHSSFVRLVNAWYVRRPALLQMRT